MSQLNLNSREEWLEARKGFITGTDVAKILGVSKFGDAVQVWQDKLGQLEKRPPTRRMIAGLRYQGAILDDYAAETRHQIQHVPDFRIDVKDGSRIAASLDALDITDGGLPVDAKNVGFLKTEAGWGKPGTAEIPDDYRFQLAAQMLVTGAKLARLAVLVGGVDLVVYEMPHNAELEAMMIEAADKFWRDHIVTQKPPKLTPSEEAQTLLSKLYPVAQHYAIEGTDEDLVWQNYLRCADVDYKDAKRRKDEAQIWFKQKLGDAEMFCGKNGDIITWKNDRPSESIDWEKVAAKIALRSGLTRVPEDILNECKSIRPGSRRFICKWAKGDK